MPKFIININPYFVGGHVDTTRLIDDIISNAMPIKKLKFMDFIDAGNGVYAFLHEGEIIYIGKCSSRSFCERISSHISKSPHGYMNNVMKKIAWFCSSKNLSKDEFLADTNEPDRTDSFRKAEKIMKDIKIVCISFEAFSSSTKKKEICQLEKKLINSRPLNPLLNRRFKSHSSIKKTSSLFLKTITKSK